MIEYSLIRSLNVRLFKCKHSYLKICPKWNSGHWCRFKINIERTRRSKPLVKENVGRVRVEPVLHVDKGLEGCVRDRAVVKDVPTAFQVMCSTLVVNIFRLEQFLRACEFLQRNLEI